ncbi:helicase-like [Dehalococcoides mccartyi]|uniref:Helicase-like n=1 Tax=Dehalococcoides mccartyi TaxID=61435 RepID=A0A328ET56_9CHLR|nr:helicase-like [Dehalococcoides mccartyi]
MDMARAAISQLKPFYRSGESNIGQDFFFLCISYCSSYSRAVGFFSSSTLITWAKILPELVAREKASIRLLISPQLPESDRNALQEIVHPEERDRFIQRWVSTIIQEATKFAETPSDSTLRIRLFLWLVATGRLEIRIAFPQHIEQPGIFHEKSEYFNSRGESKWHSPGQQMKRPWDIPRTMSQSMYIAVGSQRMQIEFKLKLNSSKMLGLVGPGSTNITAFCGNNILHHRNCPARQSIR